MATKYRVLVLAGLCLALTGCSITQTVDPIKATNVSQVCVLDNPKVLMDDFQGELQRQIQAKGLATKQYSNARPADCSHYLEYTANWGWDMAMYLTYAEMRVYDHEGLAGQAVYDARRGGGRLDKFGRTAEKIHPLIDQLFGATSAGPLAVPAVTAAEPSSSSGASETAARLQEIQRLKDQGVITEEEYARKRQAILDGI